MLTFLKELEWGGQMVLKWRYKLQPVLGGYYKLPETPVIYPGCSESS
jgi:hypothetical protein